MRVKKCGIYKLTIVGCPEFYIGSSVDIQNRYTMHLSSLLKGKHHSIYMQRVFDKSESRKLTIDILELVSADLLIKTEQKYIDEYSPQLNIAKVAGSSLGIKRSAECIEKIKKAGIGRKISKETIAKRVLSRAGYRHSELTKSRIKGHGGVVHTEEFKQRRSLAQHGIAPACAFVTKEIIQLSREGLFIKHWPSLKDASQSLGINLGNISECLYSRRKTAGNYKWTFKNIKSC